MAARSAPFDLYPFARGGGAITILNDETIRADVEAHADDIVQGTNGQLRPYYTQNPVCRTPDASAPRCSENVYAQIFDYDAGEGELQRFVRPRGVAISPFVAVERPFFGDVVHPGTRIQLRWWDPAVSGLMIEVFDLGADASEPPRSIRSQNIPLTPVRLRTRTAAPLFKHLLPAAVDGRRYRLDIKVTAGWPAVHNPEPRGSVHSVMRAPHLRLVALSIGVAATAGVSLYAQQQPLTQLQFDIVGVRLVVDPPALTVPKNIATQINTSLALPPNVRTRNARGDRHAHRRRPRRSRAARARSPADAHRHARGPADSDPAARDPRRLLPRRHPPDQERQNDSRRDGAGRTAGDDDSRSASSAKSLSPT